MANNRITDVGIQMTPEQIRTAARALDKVARDHCPEGCRPDLVIGAAIDHLYAMAAAEEFMPR